MQSMFRRGWRDMLGVLLLLLALLLGVWLRYSRPQQLLLRAPSLTQTLPAAGVYAAEHSDLFGWDYRWTDGQALLELPAPGVGRLSWSGVVGATAEQPLPVDICQQQGCLHIASVGQPRTIHMLLTASPPRLKLALSGPTTTIGGDARPLGVYIGPQMLVVGATRPPWRTLALLLTTALTLYLALRALGSRWWAAAGLSAAALLALLAWDYSGLWQFALLPLLLGLLLLGALGSLGLAWYARWRPLQPLAWPPTAPPWQRREWLIGLGIAGLWLLTRLIAVGLPERVGDLELFTRWANIQAQQGLGAAYALGSDNMPGNLYLLWLQGRLAQALGLALPDTLPYAAALLMKAPALLAEAACLLLIWRYGRRWWSPRWAWLLPLIYMLTPSIWINAGWWGQTDALIILALLGSVLSLERAQGRWAWALWALAALFKLQAVFALPLLLIATARRWGARAVLHNGLLAAALLAIGMLPMQLAGHGDGVYLAVFKSVERWPFPTAGAYNGWYLLTGGRGNMDGPGGAPTYMRDTDVLALGLTYRQVGMLAFGLGLLLVGWLCWRQRQQSRHWLVLATAALIFFVLPTQIHERFMSFTFAPLLLAAAQQRRLLAAYAALALANAINLLRALGFVPLLQDWLQAPAWAMLSAALTVATLLYVLWTLALPAARRYPVSHSLHQSPPSLR